MPKCSILGKARAADICREPFPHIVINNALDEDIYEALIREIPDKKLSRTKGPTRIASSERAPRSCLR